MTKIGILVHCRHLDTDAWEDLVFGQPERNKLGDHATLVWVILTLAQSEEIACIVIGQGPSKRDGLDEGNYSKKFLLDNFDRLGEFSLLRPLLAKQSSTEKAMLRSILEMTIITNKISNTVHEIEEAAKIFTSVGVEKVIQICAASHAPRCIKEQSVARSKGVINENQLWQTIATDMSYHNTAPEDVCIIDPPHRLDQSMAQAHPGLSEVIVPYFSLKNEDKQDFIRLVDKFMTARHTLP